MFNNIGKKIMTLAKVLCWIGIIFSVIAGIVIMLTSNTTVNGVQVSQGAKIFMGIFIMIVGSLCSWIGSFVLYGFGSLIETNRQTAELLQKSEAKN